MLDEEGGMLHRPARESPEVADLSCGVYRPALQNGPEDSPSRVLLSKVKQQLFSREPLAGEQEILEEMQAEIEAIGSLMKRIGASTWSDEELPEGQEAA